MGTKLLNNPKMSCDKVQVPFLEGHHDYDHCSSSLADLASVTGLSSPALEPIGNCNKILCGMEIGTYMATSMKD